jgi:hypothetical protein
LKNKHLRLFWNIFVVEEFLVELLKISSNNVVGVKLLSVLVAGNLEHLLGGGRDQLHALQTLADILSLIGCNLDLHFKFFSPFFNRVEFVFVVLVELDNVFNHLILQFIRVHHLVGLQVHIFKLEEVRLLAKILVLSHQFGVCELQFVDCFFQHAHSL